MTMVHQNSLIRFYPYLSHRFLEISYFMSLGFDNLRDDWYDHLQCISRNNLVILIASNQGGSSRV